MHKLTQQRNGGRPIITQGKFFLVDCVCLNVNRMISRKDDPLHVSQRFGHICCRICRIPYAATSAQKNHEWPHHHYGKPQTRNNSAVTQILFIFSSNVSIEILSTLATKRRYSVCRTLHEHNTTIKVQTYECFKIAVRYYFQRSTTTTCIWNQEEHTVLELLGTCTNEQRFCRSRRKDKANILNRDSPKPARQNGISNQLL